MAATDIIDLYFVGAKHFLDPSQDQANYASFKTTAISLSLSTYGYSSEGLLPADNLTVWQQLIACEACRHLLITCGVNALALPLKKQGGTGEEAQYEIRQRILTRLDNMFLSRVQTLEEKVNATNKAITGPIFQMAIVDKNTKYDGDGNVVEREVLV